MNDLTLICEKITRLAETGGEFTADHVRERLPAVDTKFLGQAFRQLNNRKVITLVRYEKSTTDVRNRAVVGVWKGNTRRINYG